MISLESANLLKTYVEKMASTAPVGWQKIVIYEEALKNDDHVMNNMCMATVSSNGEKIDDFSPGAEAYFALVALYDYFSERGEAWSGIRVVVDSLGKYSSKFYYNSTPLLDANYDEAERRLDEE